MIASMLKNIERQFRASSDLEKAIMYLKSLESREWSEGRIVIDGQRVFAIHSSYITKKPDCQVDLEGHRKYIDMQFMVSGVETIGYAPADIVTVTNRYNEDIDAWIGNAPTATIGWLALNEGSLAIFFPEDAHAPGYAAGSPSNVKKVVVKFLAF